MATSGGYGWGGLSKLGKASVISGIGGALQGGVAAYFGAKTEKYKTQSLALSIQHKKDMTLFNKRMKEQQVWQIGRAYNQRLQILGLKQGQAEGTARATTAARGITLGVGSTKNAFVSAKVLGEIDRLTMNSNKVRAMENKKLEAVNLGISATMLGVSESNMFATASSISPWLNMSSSLLTGAGSVLSSLPEGMLRKG